MCILPPGQISSYDDDFPYEPYLLPFYVDSNSHFMPGSKQKIDAL